VPEVGNGREREVQKTIDGYHAAAKQIAAIKPQTIILYFGTELTNIF
jgi:hypothetical protein